MLEQSDRARRMVEQELADTNETLGDQTCTNQSIQAAKMKLDNEMQTLMLILMKWLLKLVSLKKRLREL